MEDPCRKSGEEGVIEDPGFDYGEGDDREIVCEGQFFDGSAQERSKTSGCYSLHYLFTQSRRRTVILLHLH